MNDQRNQTIDHMKRTFLIFLIILWLVKALGFQGSLVQKFFSKSTETFWSISSISSNLTTKNFEHIKQFNLLFL